MACKNVVERESCSAAGQGQQRRLSRPAGKATRHRPWIPATWRGVRRPLAPRRPGWPHATRPPRGFKLAQLRPPLLAAAAAAPVPFPPSLFFRFAFFSLLLLHSACKISFPVMAQADENSQQFLRVRAAFPVCNKVLLLHYSMQGLPRPKRFCSPSQQRCWIGIY